MNKCDELSWKTCVPTILANKKGLICMFDIIFTYLFTKMVTVFYILFMIIVLLLLHGRLK